MEIENIGLIILAAGNSSRMGEPKQLLPFEGKTFLQCTIDAALGSKATSKVVVLGADKDEIKKSFRADSIPVIHNPEWEKGMASTMQKGLQYLIKFKKLDQVILVLCDQPFVHSGILDSLIEIQKSTGKGIVACKYADTLGVPALFTQQYFAEMMGLKSSEGAKKVIYNHLEDVAEVDFPKGAVDIDTYEEYEELMRNIPKQKS
jgi:molybdenum cofactor cytidylyltransferase